jgi:hypothetical protein
MAVVATTPSPRVLPKVMTPSTSDNMPESSMQLSVDTPSGKRKVEEGELYSPLSPICTKLTP